MAQLSFQYGEIPPTRALLEYQFCGYLLSRLVPSPMSSYLYLGKWTQVRRLVTRSYGDRRALGKSCGKDGEVFKDVLMLIKKNPV